LGEVTDDISFPHIE
jgi:hypothetical protein